VGLNVILASEDKALVEFCREVLFQLFGTEWTLETGVPRRIISPDSLCIWDVAPGEITIPHNLESAELRRNWFIVYREDLAALHQVLGRSDLNVLLKPVTRAALQSFLRGAAQQRNEGNGDSAECMNALRDERDDMLEFLIQANLKLQEYEQERSNFLARSVHDFRAPLTAISGYCGLLLEEALGPVTPEQREVLGRVQRSATRLSCTSSAMFDLTVPRSVAEAKLNLEEADIRDCFDQALHEVSLLLEKKRISLTIDIEPPPDGLLFGKSQIEQAVVNLLDNACKFTPCNGSIEIKGYPFFWDRRRGGPAAIDQTRDRRFEQVKSFNSFRVDIRDSGPGIPAVDVDKVFEECTSYSGGQDRSGAGLGLATCRMILQWHRGRIWAESSPSGAVFSFVLPLHPQTNTRLCGVNSSAGRVQLAGLRDN